MSVLCRAELHVIQQNQGVAVGKDGNRRKALGLGSAGLLWLEAVTRGSQ